ncbi:YraN family protein [Daejeonella sp.]|uniref:YraN family protein n=1 Tax=Daejeonella sp. TaxID=2805397 RepID=UPI0030BCC7F0
MATHNDTGTKGEAIAKKHLEDNGYQILEVNWRCRRAEVDLIAFKDSTLIFAEVKTRTGNSYGEPEDFVTYAKQGLMEFAAEEYIYKTGHSDDIRFDIISILFDKFENYKVNHIEDAFWPGS